MEEVWKDLNLPSLVQDQPQLTNNHTKNSNPFPGMMLQDFLARSFKSRDPPTTATTGPSNPDPLFDSFGATGTPLPSPPPPPAHRVPATILSLNASASDPITSPNQNQQQLQSQSSIGSLSFGSAFDTFGSSPVFPSSCKKRSNENGEKSGDRSDRRHKRMIKNRESAARSRARKQAYTYELEHEVAHLLKENAKLRMQQERLLADAAQLPKKHSLRRTLTAPF